ncbi:MAG: divalent-cation tolerance protein CutA [Candidatus Methanoperedens sp.]|nr:divalent-cation tolerance protein CutA [Candidatus Methanoperedens sp.]
MFSIIYITAGSLDEAKSIGRTLVEERLAACANIFPINSIFRWKDNIEEAEEFGIIVKTKTDRVKDVEKRVKQLHSYEVPCIVSFKIGSGLEDYLKWIGESVS